jgi:dihydrofolate reductase
MEDIAGRSQHQRNPEIETATGKNMHVVGGATLVGSLMNAGLIDEVHLMLNPLVLCGGKALFKDVRERQALKFVQAKSLKSGKVKLTYTATS